MSEFRSTAEWRNRSLGIWEELDHEKITNAIRGELKIDLGGWDLEALGEMVFGAAEKWLARDCEWMELEGVEERFEWEGESGIYDMVGRFTDEAPENLRGKKFVRDWKTTKGSLDAAWVERYTDSWQWRIYLYAAEAEIFMYSGVGRNGDLREFYLSRPSNLEEQVRTQLLGLGIQREGLIGSGMLVYPMNRPFACRAFGRECENLVDCRGYSMPKQALENWNWSPTSMEQYLICPERMRRSQLRKLAGEEIRGGMDAEIGNAFHRGIAEVYKQCFTLTR